MNKKQLEKLSPRQLVKYYKTLDAPSFEEMDGEFEACMVGKTNQLSKISTKLVMYNPYLYGRWQRKGFTSESNDRGHGYNTFKKSGGIRRQVRMNTRITQSGFDKKPAFQLKYAPYKNLLALSSTVDEVRKIKDGFYLGIGTFVISNNIRLNPMPFILEGPVAPFVGSDKLEK